MKHIVFFSGGIGSWAAAKRVLKKHGIMNTILIFTDTYIEDEDLYRFILETSQEMFQIDQTDLINLTQYIPKVSHQAMEQRKLFLQELARLTMERSPYLVWISDGREPWETFKDSRFIGNSRIAPCSHKLKQDIARKWMEKHYRPNECTLYLGIDWSEEKRTKSPVENWKPYEVQYPMCEAPYLTKDEMIHELNSLGIEEPELYKLGFKHNNCSGFCVRGGQKHFIQLLENKPELFYYHEDKEQEMREYLAKDVSILRRTRNKVKMPLTLRQLREEHQTN